MHVTKLSRIAATVALASALALPGIAPAHAETRTLDGPGLTGVVPEVQTFTASSGGDFFPTATTTIFVEDSSLTDEANLLADELVALDLSNDLQMGRRPAVATTGTPSAGDIVLSVGAVDGVTSDEGYSLVVDDHVTIEGPSDAGVFYGTRTLLQSLANAGGAQGGTVVDQPTVDVRSLHVDAARKYFSPGWFHDQIRQMSYVKLNQLQYHFSENEGFRLESTSHPEIVSDEFITKAELAEIIALAERHHIEVVPALDVPGHMRQALNAHPEWRAAQTTEGEKILDYSKPEVRQFVFDLIDEYAPLFPSTAWHLGGDEVFDIENNATTVEQRFPQLQKYAQDEAGSDKVMDGYVHYINTVAEYLNAKGKTDVRAWNDAVYTPGSTVKLNSNIDIAYWTKWHWTMPTLQTILDNGHDVINFNDGYFYYVLTSPGRAYFTKPTAQKIYNGWTPGKFPNNTLTLPNDHAQLLGASFAIWNDEPDQDTEQGVADGIKMPLRAMASRSWNAISSASFTEWNTRAVAIGDAPVAADPVAPELAAAVTATPAGTVDPGTSQTWLTTVDNTGRDARTTVMVDYSSLDAVASLGAVRTMMVDADGNAVGEPGTNLARGGAVRASGTEVNDGRWGPSEAVDGDVATRFSSNTADDAWLEVQLVEPAVVDHVTIRWELAAARFKIQVSADGNTWTDATAELNGQVQGTSTVELDVTTPVSWVRMQSIERSPAQDGQKYGVSLFEFEVWDGPETGMVVPEPVVDGATVTWNGLIPSGYTLEIERSSVIDEDAAAATDFVVTAVVDSPYFPEAATAEEAGAVSGTPADVTPPVITPVAPVSAIQGTPVSVEVNASDDSGTVTFSATGLPAGLTINPTTGVISGTPTVNGNFTATVTATDAAGNSASANVVFTVAEPVAEPPVSSEYTRTAPYTLEGEHTVGERQWRTTCEPYSQTERCRAEIWASVVKRTGNVYTIERAWAFNNLTYLPFMERDRWATNPLGGFGEYRHRGEFVGTDGRQWRVECDTEVSGRNGCRAYRMTTVYTATPRAGGGYAFGQSNEWVFNNIVLFGNYSK